jgi:UDPglucose 6-dehydrogenase
MKISYANGIARLCELAGADVIDVTQVMGLDDRIGPEFLNAGIGYGGYCFPKDLIAFQRLSERLGYRFGLLEETARINDDALASAFNKIEGATWNLEAKRIAILGLSFKPGTDDVRFSPSLALARRILEAGAQVVGYDPVASVNAKNELWELEIADSVMSALTGADCFVLATDWDEFRGLDLDEAARRMNDPVAIDGRNLFDPDAMKAAGFAYYPVGRPPIPGRSAGA